MTSKNIGSHRMANQWIQGHKAAVPSTPVDVVRWLGCIQAQDFAMAKWAIGLRVGDVTEAEIDRDFNEGKILRTHILRPTWHFVLPEDIGWMLRLTAPKVKAFCKGLHRKLGIDEAILKRSKRILIKALTGDKQHTREQLVQLLQKGRINTDDIRTAFLLMDAELDGIICSGGRQGKQFTYALLQERVPGLRYLDEDEAIGELAWRYFASRGPATLQDFSWWSGLNLSKAKRGIALNKQRLACDVSGGQAYWFSLDPAGQVPKKNQIHLLPGFDEYTVAYKDRSDVLDRSFHKSTGHGLKPTILVDGQIVGTWRRTISKENVVVELEPFTALRKSVQRPIRAAAGRYARFIGKELVF